VRVFRLCWVPFFYNSIMLGIVTVAHLRPLVHLGRSTHGSEVGIRDRGEGKFRVFGLLGIDMRLENLINKMEKNGEL